jgi:hypothetical protein
MTPKTLFEFHSSCLRGYSKGDGFMATIRLYAGMINQMPGLIKDVKLSVASYKTELAALQKKSLSIRKDICNMDDVISSLQTSTQTQEAKLDSLETLSKNVEQFTDNVVRIDNEVADLIKQRKDEFFGKYTHLKPDCEKDLADKWKDFCSSASEWCKEHWATVVTVVAVILVAVLAVVTFGAAIAVVAAIAGIISLTLCVADGICMAVTGGKNLSAVFRESGWNVLADIFQGLQIGCDIVSIVFPASLAFKAMARIGVKTFAKTIFNTAKETTRKTMVDVFQSGFGKGIINLNKTAFKAFIFDIDDLARLRNGGSVLKLGEKIDVRLPENATKIQKGNYGEMRMDASFESKGHNRVSIDRVTSLDTPTHKGIDGVYFNEGPPPRYSVAEAKYKTGRLSKLVDGTPQMSDKWIRKRLANAVDKDTYRQIEKIGYDRVLVKVDVNGNATHYLLDDMGECAKILDSLQRC